MPSMSGAGRIKEALFDAADLYSCARYQTRHYQRDQLTGERVYYVIRRNSNSPRKKYAVTIATP